MGSKLIESGASSNARLGKCLEGMLADRAVADGAEIRLGAVIEALDDDGSGVSVKFSSLTQAKAIN